MKAVNLLFVILLLVAVNSFLASAQIVRNQTTNASYSSVGSASNTVEGVVYTATYNQYLLRIQKHPSSTGTTCMVLNNATGAVITQQNFFGNDCRVNITLTAGTSYRIGVNYTASLADISGSATTPVVYSLGNFSHGCFGGGCETSGMTTFYNIQSIFVSNSSSPLEVFLFTPNNTAGLITSQLNFTANLSSPFNGLKNASVMIWGGNGDIVNFTNVTVNGTYNSTTIGATLFNPGTYTWNILACNQNNTCSFDPSNRTFTYGVTVNTNSFNSTSYETSYENFYSNLTIGSGLTISSSSLIYDGTSYSATVSNIGGNDYSLSKALDIPTGTGSRSWFWSIIFSNGINLNTTANTQGVGAINLSVCSSAPQNINFFNYTFKDEDTSATINATLDNINLAYYLGSGTVNKTLTATAVQSNNNIGFCFSPQNKTLTALGTIRYSNLSAYPQRIYTFPATSFTNVSTLTTLYLLSTSTGIYSSIQTSESTGATIEGVELTVERMIDNAWVTIGQQTTGSDGLATFWVNPNYPHRITGEKTGFVTAQVTLTPSQTTYTLVMTRDEGGATYNGTLTGMRWTTYPPVGPINPGTYTFLFNLTANLGNLDGQYCKLDLIEADSGSSLSSTTGGTPYGCNLSLSYTLVENVRYRSIISIDTTETNSFVILDNDAYWFTLTMNSTNNLNLRSFFQEFKDLPEFGEGLRQEFSRVIVFFFLLTLILGIITFLTGYDFANPGWAMIIVLAPIAIASTVGFFDFPGLGAVPFLQDYTIMLIMIFMIAGFVLSYVGRNSS